MFFCRLHYFFASRKNIAGANFSIDPKKLKNKKEKENVADNSWIRERKAGRSRKINHMDLLLLVLREVGPDPHMKSADMDAYIFLSFHSIFLQRKGTKIRLEQRPYHTSCEVSERVSGQFSPIFFFELSDSE